MKIVRLECHENGSHKYYEFYEKDKGNVFTRYGAIGKTQSDRFFCGTEGVTKLRAQIMSKLKKSYRFARIGDDTHFGDPQSDHVNQAIWHLTGDQNKPKKPKAKPLKMAKENWARLKDSDQIIPIW